MQEFPIGTKYVTGGKNKVMCTVVDILKTYNNADKLVSVRYVSIHQFMGQIVTDNSVLPTTIHMGFVG